MANKPGSDWGRRPAQREFVPMGGVQPLADYRFPARIPEGRAAHGRPDCACHGVIPMGSILVCLVCHRTGYDSHFAAEKLSDHVKRRHHRKARQESLAERKARQLAEREARRRAKHARQTSAEVAA